MSSLRLPSGLQANPYDTAEYIFDGDVTIEVPDEYLTEDTSAFGLSEVICIQRLVALANAAMKIRVIWGNKVALQAMQSPSIFPLLAVLLCLDKATHYSIAGAELNDGSARKKIYDYKLRADFFSDTQILLCADNRGHGRPAALYEPSGSLISREDFESIVDTLLSTHTGYGVSNSKAVFFINAIATIVAELFENTEVHGRLGLDQKPIEKNGLRGIVFKRVKILHSGEWIKLDEVDLGEAKSIGRKSIKEIEALEISVFDTGVGFYSSYSRQQLGAAVPINDEWEVVHKCLERHYDKDQSDLRPAHRAMGLYEVLRALKMVNGVLEVRSGRTYGYRTFLPGEPEYQLESGASLKRPNMPKPVLLDWDRKYVRVPTQHELLAGSSIRVVIPLL